MSESNLTPEDRNFTNITETELLIGDRYLPIIYNLLTYNILKTDQLREISGYYFRDDRFKYIIARFKRQKWIESVTESRFMQSYLYPSKRLLRAYKGKSWEKYYIGNKSLEEIIDGHRSYSLLYFINKMERCYQGTPRSSYDNPTFDFKIKCVTDNRIHFTYLFYQNGPKDEALTFKNIKEDLAKSDRRFAIIVTKHFDTKVFEQYSNNYFPKDWKMRARIIWLQVSEPLESESDIHGCKAYAFGLVTSLRDLLLWDIHQVCRNIRDHEEKVNNPTIWQMITGVIE